MDALPGASGQMDSMSAGDRRLLLRGAIQPYLAAGYLVERLTDTGATVVLLRRRANPVLALLSPLLLLLADASTRDRRVHLAVSTSGSVLIDDGHRDGTSVVSVVLAGGAGALAFGWGVGQLLVGNTGYVVVLLAGIALLLGAAVGVLRWRRRRLQA